MKVNDVRTKGSQQLTEAGHVVENEIKVRKTFVGRRWIGQHCNFNAIVDIVRSFRVRLVYHDLVVELGCRKDKISDEVLLAACAQGKERARKVNYPLDG